MLKLLSKLIFISILNVCIASVIKIPESAQKIENSNEISCTYERTIGSYKYTCYLNIDNPNGFNNFTIIEGNHLDNFTDSDVGRVHLNDQKTPIIPSIICQQFPNILDFFIVMSEIEVINVDSFTGCTNMNFLVIGSNNIPIIPSGTFANNPNLEWLRMDNNNLQEIADNVFAGTKVSFVNFSYNKLNGYRPNWFNGIEENLELLYLTSNNFTAFAAFEFEKFKNLRELDISRNPIKFLDANTFVGLSSLRELKINDAGLTTLNPSWFRMLTNIQLLELSNNNIRDLPDNAFNNLPKLFSIDLTFNDLTFVQTSAFGSSISNIQRLHLSNNELTAIDQELIDSAQSLGRVYLANNQCIDQNFNDVPMQRDEINSELEQCFLNYIGSISCDYIDLEIYPYECLLFVVNPVGNDFKEIEGEHGTDRSNYDVEIVQAVHQNTRNFPSVICRQFPYVEDIWIGDSQIEYLESESFNDCEYVWRLNIANNRITTLPNGIFFNNEYLEVFEAYSNQITGLLPFTFYGAALGVVNLENNRINQFNAQSFDSIADTLTDLFLANNRITSIPSAAFSELTRLYDIDLSHNDLGSIPTDAFAYLAELEHLELMNCSLEVIEPEWFEYLYSLRELRLDSNRIESIPQYAFEYIEKLESFSIIGNSIRSIHGNSFGDLESLRYFLADGNVIRAIDSDFFQRAVDLRWLHLEDNFCLSKNFNNVIENREAITENLSECFRTFNGFINCKYEEFITYTCELTIQNVRGREDFVEISGNHIGNKTNTDVRLLDSYRQDTRNIPSLICRQFPNLEEIIMQHNFIEIINEDSFENCQNLRFLNLDNNEITSIPDFTFINNPNLISIEIYFNKISSISRNGFANLRLEMLDIQRNFLTEIDSRWFTSMNESLSYLYLSWNRLENIAENSFEHLQSLTILDIGINPGIKLPSNVFQPLVNLTRLYLDRNEIEEIDSLWFDGLPELRFLSLEHNHIQNLQPDVFNNIPNLNRLDVGSNEITHIHSDAFGTTLANIEYFISDFNPTTSIDVAFFDQATRLNFLFLVDNICVNSNFYNIESNRGPARDQLQRCFNNFESRKEMTCIYSTNADNDISCTLLNNNPSGHDDFTEILGDLEGSRDDVEDVFAINQNMRIIPRIICEQFSGLEHMSIINSNLQRLTVDSFKKCDELSRLVLNYNEITTIPAGIFTNNRNLEELLVLQNKIHSVADSAFAGTSLSILYFGTNKLSSFNRNMLNGIETTLEELYLYDNNLRDLPENSFENLEDLEVLDIGLNFGIRLSSNIFQTLRNLEALYLDGTNLENLDPNWFAPLENLRELDIFRNNLTSLPENIFASLTSLSHLIMQENPIKVLNRNIFGENIRNIEYLNAAACQIEAIDERIFDDSVNLDILYLYDNVCASINFYDVKNNRDAVKEYFNSCMDNFRGSIECVYFMSQEYNCIIQISNIAGHDEFSTIPGEHLANSNDNDVIVIDSMYEVTINIPSIICRQFQNVREIIFEDCQVERITVDNCTNLQRLILGYNKISSIEAGTFANNPQLEILDLHLNKILTIADDAFSGTKLLNLNIGLNEMGHFNPRWFTSVAETLKDLRLYDCKILEIDNLAFENLRNLEYLDIGLNSGISLPSNVFSRLTGLKNLFIDTCGLRSIDIEWFSNLNELFELNLHSNSLMSLPADSFNNLSKLSLLSISDNRISRINLESFGSSLETIANLLASNNRIDAIERDFFERASNLNLLYLLNNVCISQNFYQVVAERNSVAEELKDCFENFH